MKTLYMIGGTMGIGKSTVCHILNQKLAHSVFLDGDWCWDADPFVVTDETKAMVMDNITHLLNNFIHCSAYENILFCWVMHEQSIIDALLSQLDTTSCRVINVSLVCQEEKLISQLKQDVACGRRQPDVIERSSQRLALYAGLNTIKVDTTNLDPEAVAEKLMCLK